MAAASSAQPAGGVAASSPPDRISVGTEMSGSRVMAIKSGKGEAGIGVAARRHVPNVVHLGLDDLGMVGPKPFGEPAGG